MRGEWVTQLMKSILGLIALDRVTRTQRSMAIGPLVEIRSWQTFDGEEIEEEEYEVETREWNKRKTKDEIEKEEENLGDREATRQWIEEDQDGNLGLAILALIYS